MQIFIRLAIAAQALFMLFVGTLFLLRPVEAAANFALAPLSLLGHATLRADMFGFFVSGALFALFYPVLTGVTVSRSYAWNVLKWLPDWPF